MILTKIPCSLSSSEMTAQSSSQLCPGIISARLVSIYDQTGTNPVSYSIHYVLVTVRILMLI
jgi:hypothetical protein